MQRKESNLKSNVFFAVLFVIFFFFSASVLPFMVSDKESGKINAAFDILLALSITVGMVYENRKSAAVLALVFGILNDVFISPPVHLSPLVFMLGAYFSSKNLKVFTKANPLTATIAAVPFLLMRSATGVFYLMSDGAQAGLAQTIFKILLLEFVYNAAAVFVMYAVVKFLYKHFKRRFFIV